MGFALLHSLNTPGPSTRHNGDEVNRNRRETKGIRWWDFPQSSNASQQRLARQFRESLAWWRQEGKRIKNDIGWFLVSLEHVAARFSAYLVSSIGTLQWYRYPNSTLEFAYRYRYSGTSIGTPLEINLVSIHEKEYRYPSSLMELEYRY
ncbi:hypothetical protein GQ457_17G008950 [Hibiscus cannabinus]